MKHIVIVGGSFSGVSTAHRILKGAAKGTSSPLKITLVSRDSHFYWNIAAPRALIPGQIPDEKIFHPIAPGFSRYPAERFEFVLGSATGVDFDSKQLEVSNADGQVRKLDYDFLILASGTRTIGDTPLKSKGSTEATKEALHEFQSRVKPAKTVAIIGAGATGVEIAGELAFEYGPSKKVILISGGPTVLPGRPASVTKTAEKALLTLNVDLRLNTKVKSPVQLPNGRQELTFSNGEKVEVDMYIPTYGVQPNSEYVPSEFLDSKGFIIVDEYFGIKGVKDVFALGDISNVEPPQFMFLDKQSIHVAKNMILSLNGKPLLPYKPSTTAMMGLQVGKKSGTGHVGNMKLPGFLVTMLRKTLFIDNLPKTVDGSMF